MGSRSRGQLQPQPEPKSITELITQHKPVTQPKPEPVNKSERQPVLVAFGISLSEY